MSDDRHRDRLSRLESRLDELRDHVERQESTIRAQRERIEALEADGDGSTSPAVLDRRSTLQAGGLLAVLLGAGSATGAPTGRVGTRARPLETLYTAALDGPLTDDESVATLSGPSLHVDGTDLAVGTLPDYDAIGEDPRGTIAGLERAFDRPRGGNRRYVSGPTHGEGDSLFEGAALAPTGEIVFAPYSSPNVGVYDPIDSTDRGSRDGTPRRSHTRPSPRVSERHAGDGHGECDASRDDGRLPDDTANR